MALQKQTVSVNLANGVDQKDDAFVSDANTYESMQDFVWDKDRRISKRFGTDGLPQTVSTNFPNPLTIGPTSIRGGTFSHNKQLLLQNKGALYSWDEQGDNWRFKGHHYPMNARTTVEHASDLKITYPSVQKYQNYLIYTYVAYNGFTAETTCRYRVYDTITENQIVNDVVIPLATGLPQIIVFSTGVFITFGATGGTRIAQVLLPSGQLSASTVIQTSPQMSIGTGWVVATIPGVGERAIAYNINSGGSYVALTNAGVLDPALVLNNPQTFSAPLAHYYSAQLNRFYIAHQFSDSTTNTRTVTVYIYTVGSGGYTLVGSDPVKSYSFDPNLDQMNRPYRAAFIDDGVTGNSVLFFLGEKELIYYGNAANAEPQDTIIYKSYSASASLGAVSVFSKNLMLFGQPVYRADRNTIYLPCEHGSNSQGTLFLLDFYKGKIEDGKPYAYVQAKTSYRTHVPINNDNFLSPACYLDANTLIFASQIATRISGDRGAINPLNPGVVYQTGLGKTVYQFHPTYAASHAYLAGSTHLSGGYLGLYDGSEFCEHGFFLQPSSLEAISQTTANRLTVAVETNGAPGVREVSRITMPPAILLSAMQSPNSYFTFYTNATTSIRVGFGFPGTTTLPTGGTFNILVSLEGTEPANEVVIKVARALASLSVNRFVMSTPTRDTLRIENAFIGDVPDISAVNYSNSLVGPGTGARSYAVIWSWTDNNGYQHRSAPAVTTQTTGNGSYPVALTAYSATVTNRKVSNVRAEFYSTVTNGTTFYRIGLLDFIPSWKLNSGSVSFVTTQTDSQIQATEILYTTGSILPNNSIEACTAVSVFKNRLVVSGTNRNYVYYSKIAQNNLPVEIAEELFLAADNNDQDVTAHAQLDDKLIVLKSQGLVAYAGDGANDRGENVSFSLPIDIASDVGSVNPSSLAITPNGLWFRSKMGIQMVGRGLDVQYPGAFVKDYNIYDVARTEVLKDDKNVREIRFVLQGTSVTLVYSYLLGKWSVLSQYGGDDATLWQGRFTRVDNQGVVHVENQTTWRDTGMPSPSYSPYFRTAWLKLKNVQDYQRIWRVIFLGALKSPNTLYVKVYYDYDTTNFDDYTFASSNITGTAYDDSVYEPEIHLRRQKCSAIQIELTVIPTGGTEESLTLTDMSFSVGVKQGLQKVKKGKKL